MPVSVIRVRYRIIIFSYKDKTFQLCLFVGCVLWCWVRFLVCLGCVGVRAGSDLVWVWVGLVWLVRWLVGWLVGWLVDLGWPVLFVWLLVSFNK